MKLKAYYKILAAVDWVDLKRFQFPRVLRKAARRLGYELSVRIDDLEKE